MKLTLTACLCLMYFVCELLFYIQKDFMMTEIKFVLLNSNDNVLICCQSVEAGELVMIDKRQYEMAFRISVGHKIARKRIAKGQKVIKYGVSIGSAIANIAIGDHVHLHNMKSDYIPSHTRQSLVGE